MQHIPLWPAVLAVLSLTATPTLAQTAIDAKELKVRAAELADSTILFEDRFGGLSKVFTSIETDRGFRPEDHHRLHLLDSGMSAFLPRTKANDALVKSLDAGAQITVTAVVRAETKSAPRFVEIDVRLPDRKGLFLEASTIVAGWKREAPYQKGVDVKKYAPATARELIVVPERFVGKPVKVDIVVGEGIGFSRSFTSAERELGLQQTNTIKVTSLHGGMVFYIEKIPANVDVILGLEKGDKITMHGRLLGEKKTGEEHFRFVVDQISHR